MDVPYLELTAARVRAGLIVAERRAVTSVEKEDCREARTALGELVEQLRKTHPLTPSEIEKVADWLFGQEAKGGI